MSFNFFVPRRLSWGVFVLDEGRTSLLASPMANLKTLKKNFLFENFFIFGLLLAATSKHTAVIPIREVASHLHVARHHKQITSSFPHSHALAKFLNCRLTLFQRLHSLNETRKRKKLTALTDKRSRAVGDEKHFPFE